MQPEVGNIITSQRTIGCCGCTEFTYRLGVFEVVMVVSVDECSKHTSNILPLTLEKSNNSKEELLQKEILALFSFKQFMLKHPRVFRGKVIPSPEPKPEPISEKVEDALKNIQLMLNVNEPEPSDMQKQMFEFMVDQLGDRIYGKK